MENVDRTDAKRRLEQALYKIRLLGYLLYKIGFTISSGTRRKMGSIAKEIEVPLTNVERVLAWCLEWIFYHNIFTSADSGNLDHGVGDVDGDVAEKLIEYYLQKEGILPLTKELRRQLGDMSKETGVPVKEAAAILEPIYKRILAKAFRGTSKKE